MLPIANDIYLYLCIMCNALRYQHEIDLYLHIGTMFLCLKSTNSIPSSLPRPWLHLEKHGKGVKVISILLICSLNLTGVGDSKPLSLVHRIHLDVCPSIVPPFIWRPRQHIRYRKDETHQPCYAHCQYHLKV